MPPDVIAVVTTLCAPLLKVEIGVGKILELRGSDDLSRSGVVRGDFPNSVDSTAKFVVFLTFDINPLRGQTF